jgi:hypothetical protein
MNAKTSKPRPPWAEPIRLNAVSRGPVRRRLAARVLVRRIARELGLDRLDALEADLVVAPWLDGAEITGEWRAAIEQTCGVTLDPLPSQPSGELSLRVLPAGSPNAPEPSAEEVIELDAEDPPDVLEGELIDLGAYVEERLALAIDPYPRKPGVAFVQPGGGDPPSPFAALNELKERLRR